MASAVGAGVMETILDDFQEINTASERYLTESSNKDYVEDWDDIVGTNRMNEFLENEVDQQDADAKAVKKKPSEDEEIVERVTIREGSLQM